MKIEKEDRAGIFMRAWEIIEKDDRIPHEEKEGILKLIQALIEAADSTPSARTKDKQVKTFTQEIIAKHSLMTLLKQQADRLDALKRISLNLNSSLVLQTVLDSVVSEAIRLVNNPLTVYIFPS